MDSEITEDTRFGQLLARCITEATVLCTKVENAIERNAVQDVICSIFGGGSNAYREKIRQLSDELDKWFNRTVNQENLVSAKVVKDIHKSLEKEKEVKVSFISCSKLKDFYLEQISNEDAKPLWNQMAQGQGEMSTNLFGETWTHIATPLIRPIINDDSRVEIVVKASVDEMKKRFDANNDGKISVGEYSKGTEKESDIIAQLGTIAAQLCTS